MTRNNDDINRRKLLIAMGAVTTSSLAGCQGDNDGSGGDGGGDLGERVPQPLVLEYYSDAGGATKLAENAVSIIKPDFEQLGIDVEINPASVANQMANKQNDKRVQNFNFGWHGVDPSRLDPHELTIREAAHWAGADGAGNNTNYADCEYTNLAVQQAQAPNEPTRRNMVNKAHSKLSQDSPSIQLVRNPYFAAYRTDTLNVNREGKAGFNQYNALPYIYSEPVDSDRIITTVSAQYAQSTVPFHLSASQMTTHWSHMVYSPLTSYTEDYELRNVLADKVETTNEGKTTRVVLKDATFHDGEPVTAEDIQFTFKLMWDNPGGFPQAVAPEYDSIDIVDDKTAEFNFPEPFLPLISKIWPRWGIYPKHVWMEAGAGNNPTNFSLDPDNIIGAGPFQVTDFQQGEFIRTDPYDDHPVHSPGHGLTMRVFRDANAEFRAFKQGEVDHFTQLSGATVAQIDSDLSDTAAVSTSSGFTNYRVNCQWSFAPTKFPTFNKACAASLNRQEINEVVFRGETEPSFAGTFFSSVHPWYPPEDMLEYPTRNPQGDVEGAKQMLRDDGWGWDDDGNLHYPPDANLSPYWPKGETPAKEYGFPCVVDGEYNQTKDMIPEYREEGN